MPNHTYYRAAARAIGRGWVQGQWRTDDGRVCLLQAVFEAMGFEGSASRMPLSVLREIDSQLARQPSYCPTMSLKLKRLRARRSAWQLTRLIFGWNDAEGRTQEEVMGALNALAGRLERRDHEYMYMKGLIDRAIRPASPVRPAKHKRLTRS